MDNLEEFRESALEIADHFGSQTVTLERTAAALFESISGDPATLVCGVAAEDATSLPMTSTPNLSGRLSPGTGIAIAGHATAYVVQSEAVPAGGSITVTIQSAGLEAAVNGEAVTLSPKSTSYTGGQVSLTDKALPAGWSLAAGDELWALVPATTAVGEAPLEGDRVVTAPTGRIRKVGGRVGVEYLVIISPIATQEAA